MRLLFVGRVSKEKDLDILVHAFRNLRREGVPVQLSIVGYGPYSAALAEMMPEACFTGYLNGTELARAYASSDIFVFPSTTDTFGNVIIEAQAAGLPVIVSDRAVRRSWSVTESTVSSPRPSTSPISPAPSAAWSPKKPLRKAMGAAARRSVGGPQLAERFPQILGRDRNYLMRGGS